MSQSKLRAGPDDMTSNPQIAFEKAWGHETCLLWPKVPPFPMLPDFSISLQSLDCHFTESARQNLEVSRRPQTSVLIQDLSLD